MKKEINVRPHVNEIQKQDKILKPMSMKPCSLKNFNKMYNSLHKSSKKNKKTPVSLLLIQFFPYNMMNFNSPGAGMISKI